MNRAFSLIELSIVLVIIGLLVGGVMAGQSLIRASEVNSVIKDYGRYEAATLAFKTKYRAVPGDMPNATSFWGDNNTHCADAAIANGTPGTCNGDGDGLVESGAAASQEGEVFMFWQHLANAGLIEGTYTGLASSGSALDTVVGTNAPAAKIATSGFSMYPSLPAILSGNANYYDGWYTSHMFYGGQLATTVTHAAVIKPREAQRIDAKIDDGKATRGNVVGAKSTLGADCTTGDAMTDDWEINLDSVTCHLHFRNFF